MLSDVTALFDAYAKNLPAEQDGVRMVPVKLYSNNAQVLRADDQGVTANEAFTAALFLPPAGSAAGNRLTLLFHGLNEGTEAKLFPWAASLAARGSAALIFPSAFHLARRPSSFLEQRATAFAERRAVANNARFSPYNAALSQRMAAHPDRFLRGMLQTWRDVVELAAAVKAGTHPSLSQHVGAGATVDFLGYSIGGYLAALAMLVEEQDLFASSRAVLFCTGAALAEVRPQTILILDTDAQDTLTRAYDTPEARAGMHPWLSDFGASAEEARWLTAMLYATPALRAALAQRAERVCVIANPSDQVFPLSAVEAALGHLPITQIPMGLHELPFNQSAALGDVYSDREGRRLLLTVIRSSAVAPELLPAFQAFVDRASSHLRAGSGSSRG